jgi:uncharacterized protein (DUF1501 family)
MFPFDASRLNDVSRRDFMATMAKSCLGVSMLPQLADLASAQSRGGKPMQVIYLFMTGAMSHLDTFDPKPKNKEVQGQTGVISTKTGGMQLSEHMTGLAKISNRFSLVRSLSTTTGAHGPARYLMRTSYKPIASTRHPGLGPWVQKLAGKISKDLPPTVQIGGGEGPGYLGAQYAPVPIGDPARGLENTKTPSYLSEKAFDKRIQLSTSFDSGFRQRAAKSSQVSGYDDLYADAIRLLRSEDLKAFDINQEPAAMKAAYGETRFGRGALLARRLVENGVRFVEVSFGSWDHHRDIFNTVPEKAAELDKVASALISDLAQRGLLDSTLVVVSSEFGRKPKINQNVGRDHHPAAFSGLLAGAKIKGGQVIGKTDDEAFYVDDEHASVEDFNATIAKAIGLKHDEEIHSKTGRPFTFSNGGTPIKKLV